MTKRLIVCCALAHFLLYACGDSEQSQNENDGLQDPPAQIERQEVVFTSDPTMNEFPIDGIRIRAKQFELAGNNDQHAWEKEYHLDTIMLFAKAKNNQRCQSNCPRAIHQLKQLNTGKLFVWLYAGSRSNQAVQLKVDLGQNTQAVSFPGGGNPIWRRAEFDVQSLGNNQLALVMADPDVFIEQVYVSQNPDLVLERYSVHISHQLGDDTNPGTRLLPVKSFAKARELLLSSPQKHLSLLLRGGETFTVTNSMTSQDAENTSHQFTFIWDSSADKSLMIAPYGSLLRPIIDGSSFRHDKSAPQSGFLVTKTTQPVNIQGIHFRDFSWTSIMAFSTSRVRLHNNFAQKIGQNFFEGARYSPACMYPKNLSNSMITNNIIRNCFNNYEQRDPLHGFYLTRIKDSLVSGNYMENINGSPIKVRRMPNAKTQIPNNTIIENNTFLYTGASKTYIHTTDGKQVGWLRYSGEDKGNGKNCPQGLVIRNNIMHYPYCNTADVINGANEICEGQVIPRCSSSNVGVCGQVCDDDPANDIKVLWQNNDEKALWQRPMAVSKYGPAYGTGHRFLDDTLRINAHDYMTYSPGSELAFNQSGETLSSRGGVQKCDLNQANDCPALHYAIEFKEKGEYFLMLKASAELSAQFQLSFADYAHSPILVDVSASESSSWIGTNTENEVISVAVPYAGVTTFSIKANRPGITIDDIFVSKQAQQYP